MAVQPLEQYLSPSFLTQRYNSQLHPGMLATYRNLSVVLSLQERAVETTLASKDDALTPEESASYDALRIPTLRDLLAFFVNRGEGENSHATSQVRRTYGLTSIQAICRVVIPIVAMQDQFLPYRRAVYTVTMMDCIHETLTTGIDLETCWSTCAEVMLWATMFAVYMSRGIATAREKELWFLNQLVKGIRGRKGQKGQLGGDWRWEWRTVREVLRRFYWCENFFGEEFKVSST